MTSAINLVLPYKINGLENSIRELAISKFDKKLCLLLLEKGHVLGFTCGVCYWRLRSNGNITYFFLVATVQGGCKKQYSYEKQCEIIFHIKLTL